MQLSIYIITGLVIMALSLLCLVFYLWKEVARHKSESKQKDAALADQKATIEEAYQRNIELVKVQYENKEKQEQLAKKTAAGERDYFEGNSL